jgi:hypothetical protein
MCFNNKIYYTKKQGLHTPEISVIYLSLIELVTPKNLIGEDGGIRTRV